MFLIAVLRYCFSLGVLWGIAKILKSGSDRLHEGGRVIDNHYVLWKRLDFVFSFSLAVIGASGMELNWVGLWDL